jgi:hypothetical protein
MKTLFLILGLLLSGWLFGAAPAKQPEFNINVHVSESRTVNHSESSPHYQYLKVTIDGRKYELESILGVRGLLALGDYRARLSEDEHENGDHDFQQVYEFQFSDKRTREFLVVGQLE